MSRLSDISANPTIREYAQGKAQSALAPVADFLAPTVPVGTSVGKYKSYTEKHRFRVPNTKRALGGQAVQLGFDAADETFNCEPHAIDIPVDRLEQLEQDDLENAMNEAADQAAEVGALSHEKAVIDAALASVGAGTDTNFTSDTVDPVDVLDAQILNVIKAAGYGSLMSVGVLFGATAFQRFKNNAKVRARVYSGSRPVGRSIADSEVSKLLIGEPGIRTSFMVYDTTAEGVAASLDFLLDTAILVFARHDAPTRRDPSFMKTFRLRNQWMVPGVYEREDGRADVAKYDWSEDIKVTNSSAAARINATNS